MQPKQLSHTHSPLPTARVNRKPFFGNDVFFQPVVQTRTGETNAIIQKQGSNETADAARPHAVPATPRTLPPLQAPLRDNEGPEPVMNLPPGRGVEVIPAAVLNCYRNSPLAQRLIFHYSQGYGAAFHLNAAQMQATNPLIQLQTSDQFNALRRNDAGTRDVQFTGLARALTFGTLGTFTVNYNGRLTVSENGDWHFAGNMNWVDRFDFDPRPLGSGDFNRSPHGEESVRIAAVLLRGVPFSITTDNVPVEQSRSDYCASYLGFSSSHQPTPITYSGECRAMLSTYYWLTH